jgi:hypothetical protein
VLLVRLFSVRTSPFDTGTKIRRLISASGNVCGYSIGRTNAATTSALCNMNEASAVHRLAGCSSITANPENMAPSPPQWFCWEIKTPSLADQHDAAKK